MVWLLLACGDPALVASPPGPAASSPEAPSAPPPGAVRRPDGARFVRASSLNLRDAPGGRKLGVLPINAPVEVLEAADGAVRVRAGNGREGWVPADLLGDRPVTVDDALAEAARDPERALAWSERAAAVDPRDRRALGALEGALRAAGLADRADRVARQMAWPADIRLAGAHREGEPGVLVLEWSHHYQAPDWAPSLSSSWSAPLGPDALRRLGVALGQEVHVLPGRSPATVGRVVGVEHRGFNECGGSSGFVLRVEAAIPAGDRVVAWTLSAPPASWSSPPRPFDEAAAIARVEAWSQGRSMPERRISVVDGEGGARARVEWRVSRPEDEDVPLWAWVDLRLSEDGGVEVVREQSEWGSYIGVPAPVAGRDLDGDGRIDTVFADGCSMAVEDAGGVERDRTENLCCGC